jgi:hypothetical protein
VAAVRKLFKGKKRMRESDLIKKLTIESKSWWFRVTPMGANLFLQQMEREGILRSEYDMKALDRFYYPGKKMSESRDESVFDKPQWVADFKAGWEASKKAKKYVVPKVAYNRARVSKKHGISWIDGYAAYIDYKRGAYAQQGVKDAKKMGLIKESLGEAKGNIHTPKSMAAALKRGLGGAKVTITETRGSLNGQAFKGSKFTRPAPGWDGIVIAIMEVAPRKGDAFRVFTQINFTPGEEYAGHATADAPRGTVPFPKDSKLDRFIKRAGMVMGDWLTAPSMEDLDRDLAALTEEVVTETQGDTRRLYLKL